MTPGVMASDKGESGLPGRSVTRPHDAVTAEYQDLGGLLSERTWQLWTRSSFLARLPSTMALLGLVLPGHAETGSLATGARLAGVTSFCAGLAGPENPYRLISAALGISEPGGPAPSLPAVIPKASRPSTLTSPPVWRKTWQNSPRRCPPRASPRPPSLRRGA
jgi:hypothetical protein